MPRVLAIDLKNLKVQTYETKRDAENTGNGKQIFATEKDLAAAQGISGRDMVNLWNKFSGQEVKKFASKAEGARRIWSLAMGKLSAPKKVKPKAATASGKGRTGNRGMCLKPRVEENPYRPGSKSHTAFQMVLDKPGLVFAVYVDCGARVNTLNGAIRDGYVSLSKPT